MAKPNRETDLLIIGNGVAGIRAAAAARREDPALRILIVSGESCPAYAAGALPDYLAGHIPREEIFIRRAEDYEKDGVGVLFGEEVLEIRHGEKKAVTEKHVIAYDRLIYAAGSFPILPRRIEGIGLPGNRVMKTVADVDGLLAQKASSAVVVGSGAIGLEGALALKESGCERVTLVELMDRVIPKSLDRDTAALVAAEVEKRGIRVLTGESVNAVKGEGKVAFAETNHEKIPCDLVLWAVGVRPRVELAADAGVALGETGGILVDDCMATNLPDFYAAGDCTESTDRLTQKPVLNLLWEAAARQGETAGLAAAGRRKPFPGSLAVLLTYVGETPVLAFGATEDDLEGRRYRVAERSVGGGYTRLLLRRNRLVGAQMVGTLEFAGPLLALMEKGAALPAAAGDIGDIRRNIVIPHQLSSYLREFRPPGRKRKETL